MKKRNLKLLVGVCVYDRIKPITRWLHAWNQCEHYGAKLVVVHNFGDFKKTAVASSEFHSFPRWMPKVDQVQEILKYNPDYYIPRMNAGCDLGAFQEIIKNRREFPHWDAICWFADDMLPMKKNFLEPFYEKIRIPNVGMVGHCYEGNHDHPHMRTVAFCIKREVVLSLVYPRDPMLSRMNCWELEHGPNNMYKQVLGMGYKVETTQGDKDTPWCADQSLLWDSDTCWNHYLWDKYEEEFGKPVSI